MFVCLYVYLLLFFLFVCLCGICCCFVFVFVFVLFWFFFFWGGAFYSAALWVFVVVLVCWSICLVKRSIIT